jgi:hypothetical protein
VKRDQIVTNRRNVKTTLGDRVMVDNGGSAARSGEVIGPQVRVQAAARDVEQH